VAASCAFNGILVRGIVPSLKKLLSDHSLKSGEGSILKKIEECLLSGFKFQCQAAWPLIFQIWGQFFESCGKECIEISKLGLKHFGEMRTSLDANDSNSHHFSPAVRKALGFALGKAVQSLGPRLFLICFPLEVSCILPFLYFGQGFGDNSTKT
jgi:hypothetical protein